MCVRAHAHSFDQIKYPFGYKIWRLMSVFHFFFFFVEKSVLCFQ